MALSEIRAPESKTLPINSFYTYSLSTKSIDSDSMSIANSGAIKYAEVSLTGAQLMTAFTTPLLVIPAQGAGTIIQPFMICINFVCNPLGTIAQIFPACLQYGSAGGGTAFKASGVGNPYNGSNNNCYIYLIPGNTLVYSGSGDLQTTESASSTMINQPIYLATLADTPSGIQTGTFIVKVWYMVIPSA